MRQYTFVLIISLLFISCSSSQKPARVTNQSFSTTQVDVDTLMIYKNSELDKEPTPRNDRTFFLNIQYPEDALKKGVQGEVIVKLIVLKSGKTANLSIEKSVYPSLDKEALRVLSKTEFKPGIKNGRKVNAYHKVPVNFSLN